MSILEEDFVLTNGVAIPKIGFGTWKVPTDVAPQAVVDALDVGYRHIDTARVYRNEEGVGQGLQASSVPRDQVFVTTKVPSAIKTADEIDECITESLRRLATDHIDLLLIHAPKPYPPLPGDDQKTYFEENAAVWSAMEKAYRQGLLRSIGVSNFEIADLDYLLSHCDIPPMVNQIEWHIGFRQDDLTSYCQARDILVEAYSPIGTGKLLGNEHIAAVAGRCGVTVPQLCVRYALQHGCLPLPKTVHREFMVQDAAIDFVISDDDMTALDAIDLGSADD